jgi:hypothetical protein
VGNGKSIGKIKDQKLENGWEECEIKKMGKCGKINSRKLVNCLEAGKLIF